MAVRLAIHGAGGRMGRAVVQVVAERRELVLTAAIEAASSPVLGRDAGELAGVGTLGVGLTSDLTALRAADVVIDFSLPAALPALLDACERDRKSLVLATTGLSPELRARVEALAKHVPVVAAPNYSTGVVVLCHLAAQAAKLLPDFDLEVVEMHHRHKVDAPSGTALRLAEAAAQARGQTLEKDGVFARHGEVGARTDREIGVMTLRGGDVVGEHTLFVAGPGERLELTHRATSRAIFARGAVRAAAWVSARSFGLYGMEDVLGLR